MLSLYYKLKKQNIMCLTLKSRLSIPRIALKDITVYKGLRKDIGIDLTKIKHGDSFSGIIRGESCNGKIVINEFHKLYFCTDNPKLNRTTILDTLGYAYACGFNDSVETISIDGQSVINYEYKTPFTCCPIEIGKTYTSTLKKIGRRVERGLHSFKMVANIEKEIHCSTIAKCIIPKGSIYYKGRFDIETSYASNKITYVELL